MRRSFDDVVKICHSFLDKALSSHVRMSRVKYDDSTGEKKLLIKLSNGFWLEATDNKKTGNGAKLYCWWNSRKNSIEVTDLDKLLKEYLWN